jgi:cyclin-dependent kinase 8/11
MDSKKTVPFQRNQMGKIIEILGMPRREHWKGLTDMPEYPHLQSLIVSRGGMLSDLYQQPPSIGRSTAEKGSSLQTWYTNCIRQVNYPEDKSPGENGLQLLSELFEYDPEQRLTADQALHHDYFRYTDEGPNNGKIWVSNNCFEGLDELYPPRRVSTETNDIGTGSLPGTKRNGLPDDTLMPPTKRR